MEPQVRLRLGNLFDGPSDLVVLPCNTWGGVTQFVLRSVRDYDLPGPGPMVLGSVKIVPFQGSEHVAQYAAFAASVEDGVRTPASALQKIGAALGKFCAEEEAVRNVAAPLLGAGSGGIQSEKVVESLRTGFTSSAPGDAVLTINVLHTSVYDRIRGIVSGSPNDVTTTDADKDRIRVFMSYTGSSDDHAQWVLDVATFLRENGINSRVDKWHLRHGMELPQWMCNELALADKVVIISDEAYAEKANGHVGGVGWETRVIQGDMLNLSVENTKYIVVVRGEEFIRCVPDYLRAKYAIHWRASADETVKRRELVLKQAYSQTTRSICKL